MKRILFALCMLLSVAYGQTYNPSTHTVTNKALGIAQANPTDARSYYYDASLYIYRAYQSTSEANAYLNLPKYRTGQFSVIINVGGTLNPDGTFSGGTYEEYWYKDGVANGDLIIKSSVTPTDTATWNTAYRKRPVSLLYDSASNIVSLTLGDGTVLSDTLASIDGVVFTNGSQTVGDTLLVSNGVGDTAWTKNLLAGSGMIFEKLGDTVLKANIDSSTAPNIYNRDGTLTGARTVDLNGNLLTFNDDIKIGNFLFGKGAGNVTSNMIVTQRDLSFMTTAQLNAGFGDGFYALSTGIRNSYLGHSALFNVSSGSLNTASGFYSQYWNSTGSSNTSVGAYTSTNIRTGGSNVHIGYEAGYNNGSILGAASGQVMIGAGAGKNDTTSNKLYIENSTSSTPLIIGDFAVDTLRINGKLSISTVDSSGTPQNHIYINQQGRFMKGPAIVSTTYTFSNGLTEAAGAVKLGGSLTENTTLTHGAYSLTHTGDLLVANTVKVGKGRNAGTANTALGQATLDSITTGVTNTGIGYQALQNNKTGNDNTAVGVNALQLTTVGTSTAIGRSALGGNTTGLRGTANGTYSLLTNTTGNSNTGIGYSAGDGPITGSNNIYIGYYSGRWYATTSTVNTTPNQSIFIGDSTKAAADNQTNQIVIGHNAVGNGSNTATIGKGLTATYLQGKITNDSLAGTGTRIVTASSTGVLGSQAFLTASATLDFPSTGGGSSSDLTVTVTGAADGDVVSIGVPNGSVPGTSGYFAWVSAADTVTIRFANQSGSSADPASGIFKVLVWK